MRRHDLVYLRPDARFGWSGPPPASPVIRAAVAAWIAAGRPLVAARQPPGGGPLLLGLALPLALARQRVALRVAADEVTEIRPPLALASCLGGQPAAVRAVLGGLDAALGRAGVGLGAYGSLAWEVLSGEAYRHAESDIDLICDVADRPQLETALARLAEAASALPCRLDGEIRLPDGSAVAWRELAAASSDPRRRVLVKGESGVGLKPLGELLTQLVPHALAA